MPYRQQDQENIHDISEYSAQRIPPEDSHPEMTLPEVAVPFRLIADFVVRAEAVAEFLREPDLTLEARALFLTVLTTPEALNRICRLAIVCDLNVVPGKYFEDTFTGPEPEDIFDAMRPYLPADLDEYWVRLRRENPDEFSASIDDIYRQFRSSLKRTVVEDVSTGEAIPLRVSSRIGTAA
jgi:hypothetical protein